MKEPNRLVSEYLVKITKSKQAKKRPSKKSLCGMVRLKPLFKSLEYIIHNDKNITMCTISTFT